MLRTRCALLAALAIVVVVLGCNRADQPGTPGPQTPATPTTPSPPANPDPPAPPPCTFALTAEPDDFGPEGGNATLRVATAATCGWTAKTDAAWLAVEGVSSGTGSAVLKIFAHPNGTLERRRATVTINDATVTMPQDGQRQDCDYRVEPVAIVIPRDRWTGDVSIRTAPGCAWTASSVAPWLTLRATSGRGPATLTYEADFNPQTEYAARRAGVIEIRWASPAGGQNVQVTQWGNCNTVAAPAPDGLPAGATYAGSRQGGGTLTVGPQGGRVHFFVLTDPFMGCAWTAESNDTWISWDSPRLHQVNGGDGDLHFTVPAKTSSGIRRATVTLDRWTLMIVQ